MSTNAVEFELERRERQGNGNAQDEGPSTLSMTKSGKSSNLDTAGDIGRAAGGAVMAVLRAVGKLIATVWRIAGALDGALWQGVRHFLMAVTAGLGTAARAVWRGSKDFVAWLPTRAGRAYVAIAGIIWIIAGLWIADNVFFAPQDYAEPGESGPRAPVDAEDPILARIGGRYVHLSDVTAAARSVGHLREGETLTPATAFSRGLVDSYVEQRLLAREAVDEGVHRKSSVARRIQIARDRILAAALLEDRIGAVVTPEAVRAFYESQAGVTKLGDEVKARHIVVESQEEAVMLLQLLVAGGDFAELAKDNSLDRATAPLGGEIGYVTKDMVTPAFAGAAFSTEPGNFAPLFETEFGWHVLEVTDRRPTEGVRFEEVKEPIEQFLRMREIEAALAALEEEKQVTFYRPEAVQSAPETPPAGSPTN